MIATMLPDLRNEIAQEPNSETRAHSGEGEEHHYREALSGYPELGPGALGLGSDWMQRGNCGENGELKVQLIKQNRSLFG